jgi:hypothetical protein
MQIFVSHPVASAFRMLTAIDFDYQTLFAANEIYDIAAD